MPATELQMKVAEKFREELRTRPGTSEDEYWRALTRIMHIEGISSSTARGVCGRAVHRLVKSRRHPLKTTPSKAKKHRPCTEAEIQASAEAYRRAKNGE